MQAKKGATLIQCFKVFKTNKVSNIGDFVRQNQLKAIMSLRTGASANSMAGIDFLEGDTLSMPFWTF